ncbi:hypothetical protein IFM89_002539 [Coptis chinensis]|uniref:Uncharacterized protein n=1 Tax=Coptis chinensis TaxID=261450 RepID=A0A835HJD0_9MAGN|nr:hypothetical protein IFM89_002539 [Coptis chinensis]
MEDSVATFILFNFL